VSQTKLFDRITGEGVASEEVVRNIAFTDSVLQGNNSEPVELKDGRLVVLRLLEHNPSEAKSLETVQQVIVDSLQSDKAKAQARTVAEGIKQQLDSGVVFSDAVKEQGLAITEIASLKRNSGELPWQVNQAVFKAAKPTAEKATVLVVDSIEGEQTVVNLLAIIDGIQDTEQEKLELAKANIARALGQSDYSAVIEAIRLETKVSIK